MADADDALVAAHTHVAHVDRLDQQRLAALAPALLGFVAQAVPQLDQTGPPLTWAARQQLAAQGRALLAQAAGETA